MGEDYEMRTNQAGQRVDAFHISTQLNILPALTMRDGGICDALKQVRSLLHCPKKDVRVQQPRLGLTGVADLEIQGIELFPLSGAALPAPLAKFSASRRHAGKD